MVSLEITLPPSLKNMVVVIAQMTNLEHTNKKSLISMDMGIMV
jgi:hypothetical protein